MAVAHSPLRRASGLRLGAIGPAAPPVTASISLGSAPFARELRAAVARIDSRCSTEALRVDDGVAGRALAGHAAAGRDEHRHFRHAFRAAPAPGDSGHPYAGAGAAPP